VKTAKIDTVYGYKYDYIQESEILMFSDLHVDNTKIIFLNSESGPRTD